MLEYQKRVKFYLSENHLASNFRYLKTFKKEQSQMFPKYMLFDYESNFQFFAQNHVILFNSQSELVLKTETEKKVNRGNCTKKKGTLLPFGHYKKHSTVIMNTVICFFNLLFIEVQLIYHNLNVIFIGYLLCIMYSSTWFIFTLSYNSMR